ncbi:2-succinyl-5-enolpyruvyl-6-hydroxy-3-cyclohexene-1-carboxylic-acid synthase [Cellulomonas fimi]|uniref:2-succinyl-5-enolpyruvyl-6-hydroxy-3-cyclohexene-1-carboxylate synthase n=1 Tax=Cellulomonas fimi TaxID=1708 RepID=A0A7Y0LV55_CELFI|nr:2-succinyl-5-enolpyruvyl-6-hydroxy-3-cyclohexene-1-carboxylic-acid synthase [Cellulomonas fimi]NMR18792.1 2-succinyl-5-enolpyruvyl-6-hydroxy-3-cyclohexene-1-carboxylic-acid synthase [Cellulomonas fimi]
MTAPGPAPAAEPGGAPVQPAGPATAAARVLVQALARLGVRDVVLAPGSRSAPLAYALAAASLPDGERPAGAPTIRLSVRIDERSAAFLALGLARGSAVPAHGAAEPPHGAASRGPADGTTAGGGARPVAIVTTSGTATANLHPAVLEAHHAGVPLLVLTADRPHELRGTGANQTTDQVGLFGSAVRLSVDVPAPSGRPGEHADVRQLASRAVAAALGSRTGDPGPVHLNLSFREPLAPGPDDGTWPAPSSVGLSEVVRRGAADAVEPGTPAGGPLVPADVSTQPAAATEHVPTVVVAGDGAGPAARRLAEANGWPLLAEPSSGARAGDHAITAYRLLLDRPELGGAIRRAVVLGRPTLSRPVQQLLARADVEVLVVAPRGGAWPDAMRRASTVLAEVPLQLLGGVTGPAGHAGEWLARWQKAGAIAAEAIDRVLDAAPKGRRSRSGTRVRGPLLAREVARASRPDDVLVVGSSNPIRDLDLVARWDGDAPVVLANRGLAGIDGTVSTAIGVALALPRRRVRALLGDLTFLHDVGGLLRGPFEPEPNLQLVVANDDGGSIFATLEHGAPEHASAFERVFGTPHGADLGALCAGYAVRHELVRDVESLRVALATPGPGLSVVEVRVDRSRRRALTARMATAVDDAFD